MRMTNAPAEMRWQSIDSMRGCKSLSVCEKKRARTQCFWAFFTPCQDDGIRIVSGRPVYVKLNILARARPSCYERIVLGSEPNESEEQRSEEHTSELQSPMY